MRQPEHIHEEESQLINTIDRMKRQSQGYDSRGESFAHREFLDEVIEHLQTQLDRLRLHTRPS